jgi:hypothetical protein
MCRRNTNNLHIFWQKTEKKIMGRYVGKRLLEITKIRNNKAKM